MFQKRTRKKVNELAGHADQFPDFNRQDLRLRM